MLYCTGAPPTLVKNNDLKAEISEQEGHQQVASAISAFFEQMYNKNNSKLQNLKKQSKELLAPLVLAYEKEGSRYFNGPSQIGGPTEKQTCIKGGCKDSSEWGIEAQKLIVGEMHGYEFNGLNEFVYLAGDPLFSFGKYDFHLPNITISEENKTATITTYSQCSWDGRIDEIFHNMDISLKPTSASQIGTKMMSRQCLQIALQKKDDIDFSVDDPQFCKIFNQQTIDWVLSNASQKALERYQKYGKKYVLGDDVAYSTGLTWTMSSVKYDDKGDNVEVSSPLLKTEKGYWEKHFPFPRPSKIPDPSCFHYCKFLSPARVMEWVYVDSLRGREQNNIVQLQEMTIIE